MICLFVLVTEAAAEPQVRKVAEVEETLEEQTVVMRAGTWGLPI